MMGSSQQTEKKEDTNFHEGQASPEASTGGFEELQLGQLEFPRKSES